MTHSRCRERLICFAMKPFEVCTRRTFSAILAAAALVSCSPQLYDISVEMRRPSSSGLDLTGKSVAIVYPYGVTREEMQLTGAVADALASRLDAAYPESDSTALFTVQYTDDFQKMASPDSLVNLVLKTDADVVFLFGHPAEFDGGYRTGEFRLPLYCYDSLGGEKAGVKTCTVRADAGPDASLSGRNIGNNISSSFVPTWREEEFGIWYTSDGAWNSALVKATEFRWDEAVKEWLSILETAKDPALRARLEYNVGLGCFMAGNGNLALQWLEQSGREEPDELTSELAARVRKSLPSSR